MWAVAMRDGLEPHDPSSDAPSSIQIPIEKSPCGRLYLCSSAQFVVDQCGSRWKNKRFPIAEAQTMSASKLKRINITGGACRSFRIPHPTIYLNNDSMQWFAIGEPEAVRALLNDWIGFLGHKRGVGLGKVVEWNVDHADVWPGFPVARNGSPLRSLPLDWEGVSKDSDRAMRTLMPPYWRRTMEEPCLVQG